MTKILIVALVPVDFPYTFLTDCKKSTIVFAILAKSEEIILLLFPIKKSVLSLGKHHCTSYHRMQPFLYTDAKWVTF